METYILGDYK